ncbi:hypothetical protein VPH35_000821 [Triticum aestivum]
MAIREGLSLAQDLNLHRIHLALDCRGVVEEIHRGSGSVYGAVIQEIRFNSTTFTSCNIVDEFRSSNIEAHNLAKHALRLGPGQHVWLGRPTDIPFIRVNVVTVE